MESLWQYSYIYLMNHTTEYIEPGFLQTLKDKSILLYLSSCNYKDELLDLPYDYIILNSKSFGLKGQAGKIRLKGGKVILMPFDNEYCIRLMIDAGLKIRFFVGVQDGCCEGGNHECINSQTFFTRLSPLMGEDCLYLTNHLFMKRRPVEKRLPFKFRNFRLSNLPFDASCFSDFGEVTEKWQLFKVSRIPSDSVFYKIGKTEVHVHHSSLWDCKERTDGWIIPHYPPEVLRNYLPRFNPAVYLSHHEAAEKLFSWAIENKHETIAAIPFDSDKNLAKGFLDRLYRGEDAYPKCIHFYHIKDHEMQRFRDRLRQDHTRMLLGILSDRTRYKVIKEDLELGRGDPRIIPYLMLQFGPKALKPLVSGLSCPNPEMRFQCILALEKLGEPGALKHLISMFDDPENKGMEYQLRETIGQLGGWSRMAPIYYALNHGSSEVRFNMTRVLSEYGDDKVLTKLVRALKNKKVNAIQAYKPIETLATILNDRETASGVLSSCLSDGNPWIRSAAAMALGKAGNMESAKALINAIRLHPKDEHLHWYAGESLAQIFEEYEDAGLKSHLDILLADDTFLGKDGIMRVQNPEEFENENDIPREPAPKKEDLTEVSEERQIPDSNWEPVYSFENHAWEDTHLQPPASGTIEELVEMLKSEVPDVQLSAIHALRKSGNQKVVTETFGKLLPKLTSFYRHEMVEALGHLRDPEAVPVLSGIFPAAWADLKMAVIRSMKCIGGKSAEQTLLIALHDHIPKVRYLAAWALGERKSPAALKSLKQALFEEKYTYVRKQIEDSIRNYHHV
jgi:HEAT repeat protein